MDVSASGYDWFYVTATDFSGNESPHGTLWIATAAGNVTIAVYNASGARVATLVDNKPHVAGAFSTQWDGRSSDGRASASGVYFARIEHPSGTRSKKVVLLK